MYDYLQPIETMQRITREELSERLDELLEIVSRDKTISQKTEIGEVVETIKNLISEMMK